MSNMRMFTFLKEFMVEGLLVLVLILLSFGVYNPYWMPMGVQLVLLVALVVLFGFFATFFWREVGGDEREVALRHMSDRIGFLSGASLLLLAILIDGIVFHELNGWVIGALIAMVAAKVVSFGYYEHRDRS